VVDFARTTFCDSTALRLLVNAARQAHASGCRLELVHPPRQLLVMAEVLGVSDLLRLSAPSP
jgi:ABC-type transporter Mla MlaB component